MNKSPLPFMPGARFIPNYRRARRPSNAELVQLLGTTCRPRPTKLPR